MPEPSSPARRPRAFRLDGGDVAAEAARQAKLEPEPDYYEQEAQAFGKEADDESSVKSALRKGVLRRTLLSWGGLFASALGGVVALALGLWFTQFFENLFQRSPSLGYAGLALLALATLALVVLAIREIAALARQRKIARLHEAFAAARAADDTARARQLVRELTALYAQRPDMARARAHAQTLTEEIVDGRDLIDIAERSLIKPLDEAVKIEIATAAKRVSLITSISPRAVIDIVFVAAQSLRLMRRISEIYGGRPGLLGFFRLLRSILAHLTITGGLAAADSFLQQALGQGFAARVSARLGEGVLNGLLTTRVGLSAMAVCRPMPFATIPAPGVTDVAPFLFSPAKKNDEKQSNP